MPRWWHKWGWIAILDLLLAAANFGMMVHAHRNGSPGLAAMNGTAGLWCVYMAVDAYRLWGKR